MNLQLFPWAFERDPWRKVFVPSPPEGADMVQMVAFGALAGLVSAHSTAGPLYGKLDAEVKALAVAYMGAYGPADWKEPGT